MSQTATYRFPAPSEVKCTKCRRPMPSTLPGRHPYVVCGQCHTVTSFAEAQPRLVKQLKVKTEPKHQGLPIGSTGMLDGHACQVVSSALMSDHEHNYWQEYTLLHPVHGYVWLSFYQGHWHLLHYHPYLPSQSKMPDQLSVDGNSFKLFNRYKSTLHWCEGEFPDPPILRNQERYVHEYFGKKNGTEAYFSTEVSDGDMVSYIGHYIDPKAMAEAFPVLAKETYKAVGVGMAQPNPYTTVLYIAKMLVLIGLPIILAFLIIRSNLNDNKPILHKKELTTKPDPEFYETPPFKLENFRNNAEVKIGTNLSNNWLDAEVVLINRTTGQTYMMIMPIEYYHGTGWSEGSRSNSVIFSELPKGEYLGNIMFTKNVKTRKPLGSDTTTKLTSPVKVSINIIPNSTYYSNFWFFVLLAGGGLLIIWFIWINFESRRWSNSPFNPYANAEDV